MSELLPYFDCENNSESVESVFKRLIYVDGDDNIYINTSGGSSGGGGGEVYSVPELTNLVDTVDVPIGTTYYPAEEGTEMGNYKLLSLTGKLIDSDNTTSIYLQGTNDEIPLTADWITCYGYDTGTNAFVNVQSAVSGTKTFGWDFDNFSYQYWRVKLVTGDSTNTVIIKARRIY